MICLLRALCCCLLVSLTPVFSATTVSDPATTAFYYKSFTSGSYIAGPNSDPGGVLIEKNATWDFREPSDIYPNSNAREFQIYAPDGNWWISVDMPLNAIIGKGSYVATRFPFNANEMAGFNWAGFGRGLNTLTAEFNVLEVAYDANGIISAFAVDFLQYEETWDELDIPLLVANNTQGAFGSYRYNSSIPINTTGNLTLVPEPHSVLLLLAGTFAATWRPRRRAV